MAVKGEVAGLERLRPRGLRIRTRWESEDLIDGETDFVVKIPSGGWVLITEYWDVYYAKDLRTLACSILDDWGYKELARMCWNGEVEVDAPYYE